MLTPSTKLADVAEQVAERQTALTEVYEGQTDNAEQILGLQCVLAEIYERGLTKWSEFTRGS